MIPECFIEDKMKDARRAIRAAGAEIGKTGVHMVAVVADVADGRACTSMATNPEMEGLPDTEVAVLKCVLTRVLSLLVLHLGVAEAMGCAVHAVSQGAELARLAEDDTP